MPCKKYEYGIIHVTNEKFNYLKDSLKKSWEIFIIRNEFFKTHTKIWLHQWIFKNQIH